MLSHRQQIAIKCAVEMTLKSYEESITFFHQERKRNDHRVYLITYIEKVSEDLRDALSIILAACSEDAVKKSQDRDSASRTRKRFAKPYVCRGW